MNQLSVRNGPEFNFISEPDRQEFEQKILDIYDRCNARASYYIIPNIYDDMFLPSLMEKPEHFAAALLGSKHDDPEYFRNVTESMSERERFLYVKVLIDEHNMNIDPLYDDLLYEDIQAVLLFHKMSFTDIGKPRDYHGMNGYFYRNLPITQVW